MMRGSALCPYLDAFRHLCCTFEAGVSLSALLSETNGHPILVRGSTGGMIDAGQAGYLDLLIGKLNVHSEVTCTAGLD